VAASYGAQQPVNVQVEQAMVSYGQDETARLAPDMPEKDITVTQDETFTGGLCLITMDPDSHFIMLEQPAQARDQTNWNEHMEPALAQFNCRVIQSTSDEAPGLLAYVEHYLEAHHSPDLFHVQHELVKAVSGPMATKERAAHKAVTEATEQLERLQSAPKSMGDEPAKRGPGRPPKEPMSLEQARQALEAASREHERLAAQREQVKASIRASATTTILSISSAGCVATAHSSLLISKGTSSKFEPLPSTKGSARAAWIESIKRSGWCRKCKRPSSLSLVMSLSRSISST
jgi:hypothetical protein